MINQKIAREQTKKFETTVVSTRMRLARNLDSYPFPSKMSESQAKEVAVIVRNALEKLDGGWTEYDMLAVGTETGTLLKELHLISPALVGKQGATAFVSPDRNVSVMVNEEDHLREQYILKGFEVNSAYERICSLDDGIGRFLNFAYDERLGFLTACPSNVGTGLRASVMMFLPALEQCNAIEALVKKRRDCGLTVRGEFGEGTAAEGALYQISNDRTLGLSEEEILSCIKTATKEIAEAEEAERIKMVEKDGLRLRDECLRAYGTLSNCAKIEYREMRSLLTKVKLGVALQFFEVADHDDPYVFDSFIEEMRPNPFCEKYELFGADSISCDVCRAEVLAEKLPQLIKRKI